MDSMVETIKALDKLAVDHDASPLPLISKIYTSKLHPLAPDDGFIEYLTAGYKKRKKILRKSMCHVDFDNLKIQQKAHKTLCKTIKNDRELSGNWTIGILCQQEKTRGQIFRVMAQRAMVSQGREHLSLTDRTIEDHVPSNLVEDYLPTYHPPSKRIQLMKNLTFNKNNPIPVYCDLQYESIDELSIPATLLFDYIDTNFLNQFAEINLARAVSMAQEPQNIIRCTCHAGPDGSVVPCYENKKCLCYIINDKMSKFQIPRDGCRDTEFSSFKPILFTGIKSVFYRNVGFSCSELCGCAGNCTNNALMLPNKRLFPMEVYRNNEILGFGLRSNTLIPAGTPFMEFVGEILGETLEVNGHDAWGGADYAYQITYDDDRHLELLIGELGFSQNYQSLLWKLLKKNYYIDPKVFGNVARMMCHSCSSNVEVVRVFQKSLSPAHIHLLLVTMVDVTPGTPLSIDYGHAYVKDRLRSQCQCGTFLCIDGKDKDIYTNALMAKLANCHATLHDAQVLEFTNTVLKKPVARSENE